MICNLKSLAAAVLALAAFGAVAASAASAAAQFTTPGETGNVTVTIKPDGVLGSSTAHQVFDISNAAGSQQRQITCNTISGTSNAISGGTAAGINFANPQFEEECNFAGQEVTVVNGCEIEFTASGNATLKPAGCVISFENPILKCKVEVKGEQTLAGITYHNISAQEVTVSTSIQGIQYTATGTGCAYGQTSNGKYTTGNAIATAEKLGQQTMVNIAWDA
jgi:hypothetical protein